MPARPTCSREAADQSPEGRCVMTATGPDAAPVDGPELRNVFARLREAGGPALAEGQTACCYALTKDSVLLRALERILKTIT
jgi:hypothetical protein